MSTDMKVVRGSRQAEKFVKTLSDTQHVVSHSIDVTTNYHYITYETTQPTSNGMTLKDVLDVLTRGVEITLSIRDKKSYAMLDSHTFTWGYHTESSVVWKEVEPLLGCGVFGLNAGTERRFFVTVLK